MQELLKLCGYSEEEIQKEMPRVEKAFQKLGLVPADIENGKQRLYQYYDMELMGVRRIFRLCLREVINSILAGEEGKTKVVYGCMAPGYEIIGAALMKAAPEVFSINHHWAYLLVAGCIFDKFLPVMEAAEKMWLKAGLVGHCGNVKTMLGVIPLDLFPRPDLMITSGALCEIAPKTFDLIQELYGFPVHYIETCQDRELREYDAASLRAVEFQAKSLRKTLGKIREVTGCEITDDMLWEIIMVRQEMDAALRRMRSLLVNSDPLPLKPTHENLWSCLNSLTLNVEDYAYAVEALNTLCVELQDRIDRGVGVVEKGSPRIMAICPAQHDDPRLEDLINEVGIALVAIDFTFAVPYPELPLSPDIALAMSLQGSPFSSTAARISLIIKECQNLKVDGVFDRYHVGCRTVAGDALLIKEAVEKDLDIPVLLLEWDSFDPRIFNYEQFRKNLEIFKEMMLNKRRPKAAR